MTNRSSDDISVLQANIDVHTRMAQSYEQAEPHFRAENKAKVRGVLEQLRARCPGGKLLDLGCGTGFIIELARDLFDEIHGIDITQAMLDQVDLSSGTITLHRVPAEDLPFGAGAFDLVTSYSFLHHAEDYHKIIAEAYRVLKPGGILYVDLEPNQLFWNRMAALPLDQLASPILRKARESVTDTDVRVERQFGIRRDVFNAAEYGKTVMGGINPYDAANEAERLGFKSCQVRFEWYLGQGDIMHGQSFEVAARIDEYLRAISPLSDQLFKYLQIIYVK